MALSSGSAAVTGGQQSSSSIGWTWGPVLPQAKSAFGTVANPDAIVTIGGTYWQTDEDGAPVKHWLASAYQLPRNATAWQRLPDYPVRVGYPLVVTIDQTIYAVGGQNDERVLHEVYTLDLASADVEWIRGPDLPRPASRLRGGVIDGVIYAVREATGETNAETPGSASAAVLALNTADLERGWTIVAEVPKPTIRYRFAATCGGSLYVFGGGTPQPDGSIRLHDDAFVLNVETRDWRRIQPLPIKLRDASTTVLDDRYIVIAGGVEQAMNPGQTPDGLERIYLTSAYFLYDAVENVYRPLTPLRLAVADHGLVTFGGTLYAVGGEDSPYRTRTDLVQVRAALSNESNPSTAD